MPSKLSLLWYAALLASLSARADIAPADNRCDPTTAASINHIQLLVDSIRIDKPGLARVYAPDGSEFTAGQALWMKGQLRDIEKACANSDQAGAARQLDAVQTLVRAHRR